MTSSADPPDYAAAARETAKSNMEATKYQTLANRPTTTTPWGTDKWTLGADGRSTRAITLDAEDQKSLDFQQGMGAGRHKAASGMLNRAIGEMSKPVNFNKFQKHGMMSDPSARRQGQEDAAYGRATSRLDPYWQQQTGAMDIELRNQGLNPGDQAYDNAMSNVTRARTDAYSAAQNDAVTQGREESGMAFTQELGAAKYSNALRTQQISEEMQKRGWTLNEINALLAGQQISSPNTVGGAGSTAGRATGTDFTGAATSQYQGDVAKANADNANNQAMLAAAAQIAALAASDIRLKSNIVRVGTWKGYNVYEYDIEDRHEIGVMAQEVQLVNPDAVLQREDGYLMVNYGAL